MRTLHIAALPFPTVQGTQALIHAMLSALALHGHDTHLVCYPHGAFERDAPYLVHRAAGRPIDRSLRSGPSLRKVAQDLQLTRSLTSLVARLQPARIFAHHVEAALCARAARLRNVTYVAHTSLQSELGSYFPAVSQVPWSLLGKVVDGLASAATQQAFAISPRLCADLTESTGRPFRLLTPPWFEQAAVTAEEQGAARMELELDASAQVLLYAGNLDAYQGLDVLCAGLNAAMERLPKAVFLLATASEPAALLARLPPLLLARTKVVVLDGQSVRRRVHAAADLALVPRLAPGGLPVKLLDALSLGVPVLCAKRATAGFEFGAACQGVADDDPQAWSEAIVGHFDLSIEHRRAFSQAASSYMTSAHAPSAFVDRLLRTGC